MLAALVPYCEESLNLQIASYENTLQSPVSGFQHSISSGINHKNGGDSAADKYFISILYSKSEKALHIDSPATSVILTLDSCQLVLLLRNQIFSQKTYF